MAIRSFADKAIEDFYYTGKSAHKAGWANVSDVVKRKLDLLNAAANLNDLKMPPNNKLEALKGNLAGFHSIRVNDQWRVVFEWTELGPAKVRVIDYH
ncbi:MAG: type II toxin-antitoxin system RelE/ParE family toxin [Bdellovibrionales bacterium]